MMLNREQIIKALECCPNDECDKCGYSFGDCQYNLIRDALSLIKELTQEVADWEAIAEQYQKQFEDCYEEKEQLGAVKEHLDLVVEGKLKRISALEKQVLKLTEENQRLKDQLCELNAKIYELQRENEKQEEIT